MFNYLFCINFVFYFLIASKSFGDVDLSQDKENRDTQPCTKPTSPKAMGEAPGEVAEGKTNENGALQLEKLKEELTCVMCLDICFEPLTTSCGHSFCRGCLQSVFQKCGMHCPKCRQELRATSKNDCPINTVLWNTIQLLFPQETATRLKDQKNCENAEKLEIASSKRTDQMACGSRETSKQLFRKLRKQARKKGFYPGLGSRRGWPIR